MQVCNFEWLKRRRLPVGIHNAQAVLLPDGRLCVGGGQTESPEENDSAETENNLFVYAPSEDVWDEGDTPVFKFALTTFHSHLVLVGGLKSVPVLHEAVVLPSNTLWNLPSNDVGGAI